ncbi:HK97 family phage major capsid protein [Vibrio sp. N418]|uniref:phage major capsid protein n=1 Tax=Vibrio sp. (strain N418) TaxID=701176 RepID=UPI00021C076D|nr:phage major capsid protein [Vibrio sp. N418]EGU31485.1 HK97 family phage major capsid protein [Vibrio sp. N418]
MESKDLLLAMDSRIDELENRLDNTAVSNKQKFLQAEQDLTNEKTKDFKIKQWAESGERDYAIYTKGLSFENNPALAEAELNTVVIEQAIANNAVLNALGNRATQNLDYRRPVLTVRPEALLTAENTTFVPVDETTAQDYATIAGRFTKMYAFPRLTNEALEQSDVSVQSDVLRLLGEEFALTMQAQVLHGDGSGSGTKASPNQLRGITNAAIDRSNAYVEALKPAATRNRETFAAVASGVADGIGSTSDAVEANLYKLMLTVPERSQATSQFIMHPNTLGFLMQTLKDTEGRSLINMDLVRENDVWTRRISLYGANIILNETVDEIGAGNAPIIFGDYVAGYEILRPQGGAEHMIVDPYTIPDTVGFYMDALFGSTVVDHEAIAVLVCKA